MNIMFSRHEDDPRPDWTIRFLRLTPLGIDDNDVRRKYDRRRVLQQTLLSILIFVNVGLDFVL